MTRRVLKRSKTAPRIGGRKSTLLRLLLVPVFLGAFCLAYLNLIGLPDFMKIRVVSELKELGLKADFNSIRLDLVRGIVISSVEMTDESTLQFPFELSIGEAVAGIRWTSWKSLKWKIDSLTILRGNLTVPTDDATAGALRFAVDNIGSEIRFLESDEWRLDHFKTHVEGISLRISGRILNASQLSKMPKFEFGKSKEEEDKQKSMERFRIALQKTLLHLKNGIEHFNFPMEPDIRVHFVLDPLNPDQSSTGFQLFVPQALTRGVDLRGVNINVQADLVEAKSINGTLEVRVDSVESEQISLRKGIVSGAYSQPIDEALPDAMTFTLTATDLISGVASAELLELTAETRSDGLGDSMSASLSGTLGQVETPHASLPSARFEADFQHQWNLESIDSAKAFFHLPESQTQWGTVRNARVGFGQSPGETLYQPADSRQDWGWWNWLAPFRFGVHLEIEAISGDYLTLSNADIQMAFRAPMVELKTFTADLYQGSLGVKGSLDIHSRLVSSEVESGFDWKGLMPLLNEKGRKWLSQYDWDTPPQVKGRARFVCPSWSDQNPDWPEQFRRTLEIYSRFTTSDTAFRTIPILEASGHVLRTNSNWVLPDLKIKRPEGSILLQHKYDPSSKEFLWRFDGAVFPRAVIPLFEQDVGPIMDRFEFNQPARVAGEARGYVYSPDKLGFSGRIELPEFTYRGESFTLFNSSISYTNKVVDLQNAELRFKDEFLISKNLAVDMNLEEVQVRDLEGKIMPGRIVRAIGEKIGRSFEPYHFLSPPELKARGIIHYRDPMRSDFHVLIHPVDFEWWKFRFRDLEGQLDWKGNHLELTGMRSGFYQGSIVGQYRFRFPVQGPAALEFESKLEGVQIKEMLEDLLEKPSESAGLMNGGIQVDSGLSNDLKTWKGSGNFQLTDGRLWNIPMFSILSPLLDLVSPGLGNSRGAKAEGGFTFENGMVHSNKIEVEEKMLTLRFNGTVNLEGNLDAKVQADILREAWLVGKAVSKALSPVSRVFEYRVYGTLAKPVMQPIYLVPRVFLAPLQPLKILRNLFNRSDH